MTLSVGLAAAFDARVNLRNRHLVDVLPNSRSRSGIFRRTPGFGNGNHSICCWPGGPHICPCSSSNACQNGSGLDVEDFWLGELCHIDSYCVINTAFEKSCKAPNTCGHQTRKTVDFHPAIIGSHGSSSRQSCAFDISTGIQHQIGLHSRIVSLDKR